MNTEYKFDRQAIAARTEELTEELRINQGENADLLEFGLRIIADRVNKDPRSYLDYGPYWWSLKKLLMARNLAAGLAMNNQIAEEYRGETDVETLVMADTFRDLCWNVFPLHKRVFA